MKTYKEFREILEVRKKVYANRLKMSPKAFNALSQLETSSNVFIREIMQDINRIKDKELRSELYDKLDDFERQVNGAMDNFAKSLNKMPLKDK